LNFKIFRTKSNFDNQEIDNSTSTVHDGDDTQNYDDILEPVDLQSISSYGGKRKKTKDSKKINLMSF
jgi:hypothetical protein